MAMTSQEVFDKAATRPLPQKRRSAQNGECRYGLRVAILQAWEAPVKSGVSNTTEVAALLECFQSIHDAGAMQDWRSRLGELAREWGLSAAAIGAMPA